MIYIKFNDQNIKIPVNSFRRINNNIIAMSSTIENTSGFKTYNNDEEVGDFSSYTTIYRTTAEEIFFSNNGSTYIEPTKTISVSIVWDDQDNIDGMRPKSVTIKANQQTFIITDPWTIDISLPISQTLVIEKVEAINSYQVIQEYNIITCQHDVKTPSWQEKIDAQVLYTGLLTDSLLEE